MKPFDVKYSTYITYSTYDDHSVESNDKDPKFEVDDHLGISKYKNAFAKGNPPHWSEEYFVTKKVKNVVLQTYAISDLSSEEIVRTFYEKELQKTNQIEFRAEIVIKRKGNGLYAK